MLRTSLRAACAVLVLAGAVPAQLTLSLSRSFVDNGAAGNGNIGVTQDDVALNYYVIDFSNTLTVHTFNVLGNPLAQFGTVGCSPSLPSPNDIAYDAVTQTLWLVDNTGGNNVLNMTRQGGCLGGWPLNAAASNPTGICVNLLTNSLFVSFDATVIEYDMAGNQLAGGFPFTPSSGSTFLSGITHVPVSGNFLITQSSGTRVFEVDPTGVLRSTTDLSGFGIVNTQGLHYSLLTNQLVVVDNSLSTVFVFDMTPCGGTVASSGAGCRDGGGTTLQATGFGCPGLGRTLTLHGSGSGDGLPMILAAGLSDTLAAGALPLPFELGPLGAPGCFVYTSSESLLTVGTTAGVARQALAIPANPALSGVQTFWQYLKLDPTLTSALKVATSNYLRVVVQ